MTYVLIIFCSLAVWIVSVVVSYYLTRLVKNIGVGFGEADAAFMAAVILIPVFNLFITIFMTIIFGILVCSGWVIELVFEDLYYYIKRRLLA